MNPEQILLIILVGLSSWTLHSVVKLREQLAALPCRKCPFPAVATAALLAILAFGPGMSADPVTNSVTELAAAAPPITEVGDPANARSLLTTIVGGIPWQTVFDWFAGVALPALFALWRQHAKNSKVLLSVIGAVEKSSVARIVKGEIDTAARQANVQGRLDKIVQTLPPSK